MQQAAEAIEQVRRTTSVPGAILKTRLRPMTTSELQQALFALDVSEGDPEETLDRAFAYTLAIGLRTADQYEREQKRRQWSSMAFRVGGVVGLVVGLVAPLSAPLAPIDLFLVGTLSGQHLAHLGYIAIAIGGALMLADRVFVATTGWTRLVTAQVAVEDRIVDVLYEWKIKQMRWRARGRMSDQEAVNEWLFLKKTADGFMEDYKSERAQWKTEILAGSNELAGHLKLDELTREARSRVASGLGGADGRTSAVNAAHLRVEVDFTDAPEGAYALVEVTPEGEPQPEEWRLEAPWPFAQVDVPRGTHLLAVSPSGVNEPIVESVTVAEGQTLRSYKPW